MSKRGQESQSAVKKSKSSAPAPKGYERTIHLLVENNVTLQRKLIGLTESIDELNKKTGRLLHLIELASEEFTKEGHEEMPRFASGKGRVGAGGRDNLIEKLDGLIQQNRTIARGLLLLEKYVREKTGVREGREEREDVRPLPEFKF